MIGTEFLPGFGLGNQLFVYAAARALALDKGYEFGVCHPEFLAKNMHSDCGMYFMDIDMGREITDEDKARMKRFDDADDRLYLGNSVHDLTHGAYVSGASPDFFRIEDDTLLYGNLQSELYFRNHMEDLKEWFKVRPEYESFEYTADDLCVIHMRCGDYENSPELWLDRSYWLMGIARMKEINPAMRFIIITDRVDSAHKILPEYKAIRGDLGEDYVTLKNARYLLLGNSSFPVFPALTSETLRLAIAPKYWARHNVSDGYWASEQNIYSCFQYMDKKGKLSTAAQCRSELKAYKESSPVYAGLNRRPGKVLHAARMARAKTLYGLYFSRKVIRSLERRTGIIKSWQDTDE